MCACVCVGCAVLCFAVPRCLEYGVVVFVTTTVLYCCCMHSAMVDDCRAGPCRVEGGEGGSGEKDQGNGGGKGDKSLTRFARDYHVDSPTELYHIGNRTYGK